MSNHQAVLLNESLQALGVASGKVLRIFDGTLGGAGHSEAILSSSNNVRLFSVDRDNSAVERATKKLERFRERFVVKHGNFCDLPMLLSQFSKDELAVLMWEFSDQQLFDGMLLDLGISSDQLDDAERGFSFRHSDKLDMRMDCSKGKTAADILNDSSLGELIKVFKKGGVGASSAFLAKEVVKQRPIESAQTFSKICVEVFSRKNKKSKKQGTSHYATVPFQALRIEVNQELEAIEKFLEIANAYLAPNGVLAIICFHSIEDKLVTNAMRGWSRGEDTPFEINASAAGEILTKKPIKAGAEEIENNVRARSALLRVFRKRGGVMNYAVGWNQKYAFNRKVERQYVAPRKKTFSWTIAPACFLFVVLMLQLHVRLSIVGKSYDLEQLRDSAMQKQDQIREIKLSLERVTEPDFIMQMAKTKLNLALTPPQRIRKITID